MQKQSQVLLLIEIDSEDTRGIIAGKLFEYMVSGRPIIAMGPKEWDVIPILTETQTGVFVDYNGKERLKTILKTYYKQYKEGLLKVTPIGIEHYSRRALTKRLAQLILNSKI